MALTNAEKVRAYRERKKARARRQVTTVSETPTYLRRPFSEFIAGKSLLLDENLDAFGVQIAGTGFDEEAQEFETQHVRDEPLNSLQRATALVSVFIEAAGELATLINQYKLDEIERAIDDAVEASANLPRGDVDALKASFVEIDRLKAIRTELRTPKRFTFPAITVKGE